MYSVEDYLRITLNDARAQWESVARRMPVESGRQVDFVPVESLLCLFASAVVDHRRYGGSTSHKAVEPVPTLARMYRRPNSSVLAKMANLDGTRPHGAKHEVEVASRLLADPQLMTRTYRTILSGARAAGLNQDVLPDFLHLESSESDLHLLGQEELHQSDIQTAVSGTVEAWANKWPDLDERVTERLLVAATRIGQHRFATEVLGNCGNQCVFCGLSVSVGGKRARRMLVASHIKPWKDSATRERLDAQNGLAACPTHDTAFDTGLITVGDDCRIQVEPEILRVAEQDNATRAAFGTPPLASHLLLPVSAVRPHSKYTAWHRENVYQR